MIEDVFSKFKEEFANMGKFFERDFEAFDLGREQRPKSRGFSIRIVSGTGREPKVSIQTFGDMNKDEVRKQVSNHLGVEPQPPAGQAASQHAAKQQPKARIIEETEEPQTEIRQSGSSITVSMKLPGVRSWEDIQLTELESSIEVKAYANNKAYFKILKKPENFRITGRKFADERLELTLA